MNDPVVSLPVARNVMKLIRDGACSDAFEALGITSEDFAFAISSSPFVGADRSLVSGVLNMLTYGVLDVMGLPRIEVPAEFKAGVIAAFISPANMMVCCRWIEVSPVATEMAVGGSMQPCSAHQLFSLCCLLYGDQPVGVESWRKKMQHAVREQAGETTELGNEEAAE